MTATIRCCSNHRIIRSCLAPNPPRLRDSVELGRATMNQKLGIVFATGVLVAAFAGTASAQNSTGTAAIDAGLRGAVERKDVPGVVALITDRQGVIYQG